MNLLINIDVPDVKTAEKFYCDAFALQIGRRFGEKGVELLGFPSPIYLLQKEAKSISAATSTRDYTRHWTPIHCDVVVEDLELSLTRALAAGAAQEGPIREASWGRIAQLADPFGHGWCLLQFLRRGYTEIAT